ncbi:MAG TPA: response regulator transcription factor [Clostridia bacterium]|nr:response regulator transcription factor [Clostridia bacterium]
MASEDQAEGSTPNDSQTAAPIRVIVADSEPIFRVGMRKIFALEDDIRVVAQADTTEQMLGAVSKFSADLLLFETILSSNPADAVSQALALSPSLHVVLIVPDMSEEETVEFLRRGVKGIVTRSIAPDLLVRCIRKVSSGETWLDNRGVNWVIEAYRAQAAQLTNPPTRVKLTPKELWIISGVTQGLRNKDIAQEVGTTEQVVKNYLRKVYDKLGVSDRLELALYSMHHRLLENFVKPEPGKRSAAAAARQTSSGTP